MIVRSEAGLVTRMAVLATDPGRVGGTPVAAGDSLTTRVPVEPALNRLDACSVLPVRRPNRSQAHDVAPFGRSKGVGTSRDLGGGKSPFPPRGSP